jgi:outer membrane protein assembly factor BamB
LFDVVVDGVNITARIGDGLALSFLAELAHAVAGLASGKRDRAVLQLYQDDDVWELGLEATGSDVLLSVYRAGPVPEVAVHERSVSLSALREGVLSALADEPTDAHGSRSLMTTLRMGRRALAQAWPPQARRTRATPQTEVRTGRRGGLALMALAPLRELETRDAARPGEPRVERADLHALLCRGTLTVLARERQAVIGETHVFLAAERLLSLADEALEAWQHARPLFRRVAIGDAKIGLRRAPGDGPLDLSVSGPSIKTTNHRVTYPAIAAPDFALVVVDFARELCAAFESSDPSQAQNLRLANLRHTARALDERVDDALRNDSVRNDDPDAYRSFAPRPPAKTRSPRWSGGAGIRFVPRWVATVPSIDLRATFLCGDRIVVGSLKETACLDRTTGDVLWRAATPRGGSVVTPSGLVRLEPDGTLRMLDLDRGEVRFTTRFRPRTAGGATGAVVHTPGLPKLIVVAEGDRQVTAVDLVTGDIRWRHTARRPGSYRMRRAGKLVLVTGGDSAITALDVASGEVVWRVRERLPFSSAMAIDHESTFCLTGSTEGTWRLLHLDPWTGEVRYAVDLDDDCPASVGPLLTHDSVVVPVRDRNGMGARAYDRASGKLLWEQAPGLTSPGASWLVIDDLVVANSDAGVLLAVEARTGSLRYNHVFSRHVDADQPHRLEPILRSGALFVPQHQVHVVRPGDGEIIGTVPTDLIPDLVRVDEHCSVYVAEESGHLAAFAAAPKLTLVK